MGDRHRRGGKRARSGRAARGADDADGADGDTVHYVSSSSGDGRSDTRPRAAARADAGSSSDSSSGSERDARVEIAGRADGESDVEVEVEFFDPRAGDVAPVAVLLGRLARAFEGGGALGEKKGAGARGKAETETGTETETEAGCSARALAEAVCAQTRVGTVVRVSEEEHAVGVISVLGVRAHARLLAGVVRGLEAAAAAAGAEGFAAVLGKAAAEGPGARNIGLVVCERVVNLPPLVVPKMLEALFCEVEWATEDEGTEEARRMFRFDWYLYVTEVLGGGGGRKRRRGEADKAQETTYTKVEDEVWARAASERVEWTARRTGADGEVAERCMLALLVKAAKVGRVREEVARLVGAAPEAEA